MSGGNILVPIVAHVVYDLLTFLEVHQRATAQLEPAVKGDLPKKEQVNCFFFVLLIADSLVGEIPLASHPCFWGQKNLELVWDSFLQ